MTRRILSLTLLTFVIASAFVVLATRYSTSEASFPAEEKRMKVLRRQGQLKVKPTAREKASIKQNTQEEKEERELANKIPKQVPIKVKVRTEKEKAFKDLKNGNWLRDLELEVTNTSNKPIYFLAIWVVLPETVNPSGHPDGFSLRYGRIEFIDFGTPTISTDIPIQPGATHTFTIEEKYQRGWEAHKIRENKPTPKKVEIKFVQLNFGDGTGYNGTDGMPYPYKRAQSLHSPCREGPKTEDKRLAKNARSAPAFQKLSFERTPAAIVPVNFFVADTLDRQPEESPLPDINCPGTDCHFAKNSTYSCVSIPLSEVALGEH